MPGSARLDNAKQSFAVLDRLLLQLALAQHRFGGVGKQTVFFSKRLIGGGISLAWRSVREGGMYIYSIIIKYKCEFE